MVYMAYMAYKDKDRQREANRKAQARFKAKQGITNKPPSGITLPEQADLGNTLTTGTVIPKQKALLLRVKFQKALPSQGQ